MIWYTGFMSFRVEATKEGQISISAQFPNPFKRRLFIEETPNPKPEIKQPSSEIQIGKNGTNSEPIGSRRFIEPVMGFIIGRFRRQKTTEQPKSPSVRRLPDEARDLTAEIERTNQTVDRVLIPGIIIFGAAAAAFTATASFLKPPAVKIYSPAGIPENLKPPAEHLPFNVAGVINEIDLVQQNLHPEEMAQAPKVEIPSMEIASEEPEILPYEEILTEGEGQKLTDEQIIEKVVTGQGQFSQILLKLKENGEEHPSSERMISLSRLNFMKKVEDFKASANGIINNPYEYPDSNMQRKAREQLAAIDFLSDRYQKGQKMAFEIEFEYNRRAQNYSAPPPELQVYALAA